MEIKKIQVYIPMAIPASGKTVLFNSIQEFFINHYGKDAEIYILQSDQISFNLMNAIQEQNPQVTKEEAYNQSRKQYKNAYDQELYLICQKAKNSQAKHIVILLDKNHPENGLKGPLEILKTELITFKAIGIIPKVGRQLGKNLFSLTYLVSCVQRAIKRENHQTLVGTKEKICAIVLFFFSFFQNVNVLFQLQRQLEKLPFHKIIYVPFSNEEEQMDKKLRDETLEILNTIRRQKTPEEMENNCNQELKYFIGICEKYDLGFPDKEVQQKIIWKNIKEI